MCMLGGGGGVGGQVCVHVCVVHVCVCVVFWCGCLSVCVGMTVSV